MAPAVMTAPESPAPDIDAYRPAGVVISYPSEDHDIAQAVYESLQTLGETIYDRIKIFLHSKSTDGGDEIGADIKADLKKSDFLVVLYTGLFKHSHGYTGFELGFFDALIEDEVAKSGQTTRRIIYLYCGKPPSISDGIVGINIDVDGGRRKPRRLCAEIHPDCGQSRRAGPSLPRQSPIARKAGFRRRCTTTAMSWSGSAKDAGSWCPRTSFPV